VKTKRSSWVLACLCGTFAVAACSSDDPIGSGGSGGTGGSAGSGSSTGGAGPSATGGAAGTSGSAGTGGFAGSGGTSSPDSGAKHDGGNTDATPCSADDIRGKLACIPGLTIVTDTASGSAFRRFTLTIDQLVDHENPNGQHFRQRLTLLHRDEAAPVVLASTGYGLAGMQGEQTELGGLFPTNVVQVEHRYFAPSIPDPIDWKHLNIKQSAGDYHAITTALKTIYKGKWVNTGASKGGMTSVYHRRFFPADLDVTVAYVAPHSYGLADARYPEFLKTVGGDTWASCREKLAELQKTVLTRRVEIEPRMTDSYAALGGTSVALEHAVLEMPFTFWQYQAPANMTWGCSAIPAADAEVTTLFTYFSRVSYLRNFSDAGFENYTPYFYQATGQLGAPGAEDAHLVGLLQHRDTYRPAHYIPKGIDVPTWDAEAMVDVQNWVKNEAKQIIFIYGEFDPWTAGKFEIGSSGDNHIFVAPGANHGASLNRLTDADRAAAIALLQSWLGVTPVLPLQSQHAFDDETFRPRL
jgi:hypothetical protein